MKLSIISAIVATLLATSSAAPVEAPRQFQVAITFNAAAGVTYFQYIPADGEDHDIGKFIFSFFFFYYPSS